jgi:hypothetical protein
MASAPPSEQAGNTKNVVSPERKLELLGLARRSRLQWILEAGGKDFNRSQSLEDEKQNRKIPAAECLQAILNFLTDVVSDGEIIGVESLAPHECLDEDHDMNLPIPKYDGSVPPYAVFLEKLKHPHAIDIVKSMQQFTLAIENRFRDRENSSLSEYSSDGAFENEVADEIRTFLEKLHVIMRENEIWTCESFPQWEATMESSEKFLYVKLYDSLFATNILDAEKDVTLHERVKSLAFLSPEHLDMKSFQREWARRFINTEGRNSTQGGSRRGSKNVTTSSSQDLTAEFSGVDAAVKSLRSMSEARSPADKVCIEHCQDAC